MLLVALPGVAAAQTSALGRSWPTDGLALPPASAATASEATAPAYNPAALGFVEGFQFFYFGQTGTDRARHGDGLYFGMGLGPLKSGVSSEWVHGGGLPNRRRTAWSTAIGGASGSFGATWNVWSSRDAEIDAWSTVDLGVTLRPTSYLSIAAVMRDISEPDFSRGPDGLIPRRYQLGAALRPFGDWLTAGADLIGACGTACGYELMYTAALRPIEGITLTLGAAHEVVGGLPTFGLATPRGMRFQGGIVLDYAAMTGVTYAQSYDPGEPSSATYGVRLSSERYPTFRRRGGKMYAFDVGKALGGEGGFSLPELLFAGGGGLDAYSRLILDLHRAARDPQGAGILLRMGHTPLSMARAEDIRGAIRVAQEQGKKVVVYLERADDALYYVAALADQVWAAPQGSFLVNGLAAELSFYGGTLDKIGVRVEYVRVGKYKSFPEMFGKSMSEAQSEVTNSLLDDLSQRYLDSIADNRNLTPEKTRAALDLGIQSAPKMVELGLVDQLLQPDQVQDAVTELMGPDVELAGRPPPSMPARSWGSAPRIALIRVEGSISVGQSRDDPLGLSSATGSDTVAAAVRAAADDSQVKAIVIRVDSGGGDGLASDLIWREVFRARSKKPVIASMGSAAASGGYWVAAGADTIVAEPSTITGSIGAFAIKLDLGGLYEKLGIDVETVTRGPHADLFSTARGLTDAETEKMQQWIDELYGMFIERVAQSRSLDKAAVDAMGRGRVWTGRQAQERKLVDRLGSLYDAIAMARERAGYGSDDEVEVTSYGRVDAGGFAAQALGIAPAVTLPPFLADALRRAGAGVLAAGGGAVAMAPFVIDIR